ncbi:glucose-6-phosphate isomerase [Shimia thalassica]|uniref:glucose-6-phosphate isomerase n=1 Tax=Shimia thalassica TaxID=1715693 RepID=UPI0027332CBF|nr:glucose-6-phosphate isomerase [Shimia thalassica]MDP2579632.1 glucose-6-phosphate isomerase [Shimia thalassica]
MWNELIRLREATESRKISELFNDTSRASAFSLQNDGLLFDYSKTTLDHDIRTALIDLAREADVEGKRAEMFRGDKINTTEDRAVLHVASRALVGDADDIEIDGRNIMAEGRETFERMIQFSNDLRSGAWPANGPKITDVVNIGIGGSDLGPVMAYKALMPYIVGPRVHFVSNVDGADIHDALHGLDPNTTLVIVSSKTFGTQETLMNARTAMRWMEAGSDNAMERFVAISTSRERTEAFGIAPERVFGFGDWIGGRYSVWSPIGLSLMLAVGPENATEFLRGGHSMDCHFVDAPLQENMPVMLALVGLWHQKFCGYATRAVVPYEHRLSRLPAYLQQLEMESNGKSVAMDGTPLAHGGGPVVWGEPGTNGQHAFFQLIHQGTNVVPVEFIVGAMGHEPDLREHHEALLANCLAQSEALLKGRTLEEARNQLIGQGKSGDELEVLARHRVFSGNRPSTTLVYKKLTPYVLGQMIALYEHRVFVEGVILGLNSFDQWGVELGKELADGLVPAIASGKAPENANGSTRMLLEHFLALAAS